MPRQGSRIEQCVNSNPSQPSSAGEEIMGEFLKFYLILENVGGGGAIIAGIDILLVSYVPLCLL